MDLNMDCLRIIFDELPVSDLFSLAETNKKLFHVCAATIKQRFAEKQVIIQFTHRDYKFQVNEDPKEIVFVDTSRLDTIKIVRNFGHLFFNLKITPSVHNDVFYSNLFEQVNLYCSETLNKLHINMMHGENIISDIKKPFRNLQYLWMYHRFDYFNDLNMTFTQIFPALTHLESNFVRATDHHLYSQKFPKLKFLNAGDINFKSEMSEESFVELIQNNPHIKGITVDLRLIPDGVKFLQFLVKHSPNLEYLRLKEYNEMENNRNTNIHFENLKTLQLDRSYFPSNITFEGLEELETFYSSSNEWMEIVKHQKTLKKLTIGASVNDSVVLFIANADSNLVELIINSVCGYERQNHRVRYSYDQIPPCPCDAKIESIIQMIEKNKHLEKLELCSGWAATNSVFNELKNQLPDGWSITKKIDKYGADRVYFQWIKHV